MYKCNKCGLPYDNKEEHDFNCEAGFIAKEYENLIPCEICNTLVNFEDYNEHVTNCSNPFNSLFQNNMISQLNSNNPIFSSIINNQNLANPHIIFLPNNQNNENDEDDSEIDENNPEIQININPENELQNDGDLNSSNSIQNILNNFMHDFLNNDYNINISESNDSYEELTNLSETIGNVEIGIKDLNKVCKNVNEKINCPICTLDYEEGLVTNCNHKFCKDCLSKWLETNIKCPYCFVELNEN